MCTNFIPPTPRQLTEHFKVSFSTEADWPAGTWQDYATPIIVKDEAKIAARVARYGMAPKQYLPQGVRLSTINARAETIEGLKSTVLPGRTTSFVWYRCRVSLNRATNLEKQSAERLG